MRIAIVGAACVLAACGRIGFDPSTTTTSGDGAPACTFGPWGEPIRIAEVASANDDWGPWLSADRLELIFSRDDVTPNVSNLYRTTRTSPTAPFDPPVPIAELNTAGNEDDPFVSDDGLTMWFRGPDPIGGGSDDVLVTTRASRGAPFAAPRSELGLASPDQDGTPDLNPAGTRVLFASDRVAPGTKSNLDLWRATRAGSSGAFSNLQPIPELNTTEYDCCATTFGGEVLFVTNGVDPNGKFELYAATLQGETFTPPVLFAPAASADNNGDPHWSRDGKTIIFASDRPGGAGLNDLYLLERSCD